MPPRNLTATANATTLFLSWYPPVNESQNGLIILYDFNISSTPFGPSIEFESYSVSSGYPAVETLMVAFGQREEFNNYTISVSAVTSAGNGPYSTDVRIRTEQAGKMFFRCFRLTILCSKTCFKLLIIRALGLGRFKTFVRSC